MYDFHSRFRHGAVVCACVGLPLQNCACSHMKWCLAEPHSPIVRQTVLSPNHKYSCKSSLLVHLLKLCAETVHLRLSCYPFCFPKEPLLLDKSFLKTYINLGSSLLCVCGC